MNDNLLTEIIDKTKEIFKYDTYNQTINQADTKIEATYDVNFEEVKVMANGECAKELIVPSYTLKKVTFSNKNLYIVVTDTFVMYRNHILGNWETKLSYEGWG